MVYLVRSGISGTKNTESLSTCLYRCPAAWLPQRGQVCGTAPRRVVRQPQPKMTNTMRKAIPVVMNPW